VRCAFALAALGAALFAAGDPANWPLARKEQFLLTARIESEQYAGKGLTHSQKAMLTDGRVTHAAHIQSIDVYEPLFKGKDGSTERDFKDSWKFNVAAYRLAKLLGLTGMTPVSVPRVVNGRPSAVTWWVDGVLMDERERVSKNIQPPDLTRWNHQMDTIRIFDQLIYNVDRSQENLLIDRNWGVWMIDHSRSFRKWKQLRNPAAVTHCEPQLLDALEHLRREDVERELGPFLTAEEIDGLMARRDLIVQKLTGQSSSASAAAW
jgi:hypothetical protein